MPEPLQAPTRLWVEVTDVLKWVVFLLLVVVVVASSIYLYRRRETPGRGRLLLALLRAAALSLLILLLFDPLLPTTARTNSPAGTVVVLDASLSMELPAAGGRSRWDDAVARARAVSGASQIILMGAEPRTISRDSLDRVRPSAAHSRLLPALQAAGEGGAGKVVLITDGAIEDLQEVRRWLPRLGLTLETQILSGNALPDKGITEVAAPGWAEAGKPVQVQLGVVSTTQDPTPARVTIRANGAVVATGELPAADVGRVAIRQLELKPEAPPGGGLVRYDVMLEPADAWPANNTRSFYVYVGDEPAGVALVSFAPDWEPRFLHPVIQQALGLPVRSFLRAGGAAFVTGGAAADAGKRVTEDDVRRAMMESSLLIVHGAGPELPPWAREALQTKPRVLVFPRSAGVDVGGLNVPSETPGEWYISGEVPSSPIASLLVGINTEELAPLLAVHLPLDVSSASWSPLLATRGRRGSQTPIAVVTADGAKRRAVVLGSGFWRWAFRGGQQRAVYNRLWAALASWLVQEQTTTAGGAIRPVSRAIERGRAISWIAPGLAADTMRVRIYAGQRLVADTAIPVAQADTAVSSALPPGHYRYEATAYAGRRQVASGSGPLTVETYSTEYAREARPLSDLAGVASTGEVTRGRAGARPLRATIWPYLIITLLLAAEWILRRRWGLR